MKSRLNQKDKFSMLSWLDRLWPYLVIVAMGVVLVCTEYNYLARVDEQNLFLHTPLFLRQCMVVSGGFLSWAGAYLTQMLYYPPLGVAVLCLLWMLLVFLMQRTFRIPTRWLAVTLIPIAMLLLTDVYLGYWIYYLKLRGFFFVATLGVMGAVALCWIYRVLPRGFRTLFLLLAVVCCYPLMGFYALLAAILMALVGWHARGNGKAWAASDTIVALLAVAAVPLLYYRLWYHETPLENIYWTALPIYRLRLESFPAYHIPYVVIVMSLMAMAVCFREQRKALKAPKRWMDALLIGILAAVLAVFWYKDGNFHREIAMRRCVDQLDWDGVLRIARETPDEPTRDMWMMKNLALTRTGKIGEEMYNYRNGAKAANAPFSTRLVQWDGKMLYLNYGIPNYCYRWCMEDGVEYGWRVDNLKLMVKCSLVNGELDAAQKYIGLLKKTLFHRKWAQRYDDFVHNPQLVVQDPELLAILHLRSQENYLSGDDALTERFLIEHFVGTESKNPVLQEQALLASMLVRNPNLFWLRFYQYTELHKADRVPTLYQQAACLYGGMDDKVDASKMPFDKSVLESCQMFMDAFKSYRDQGMGMDQIKPRMSGFQNTYYYDYFFNHYQEEVY